MRTHKFDNSFNKIGIAVSSFSALAVLIAVILLNQSSKPKDLLIFDNAGSTSINVEVVGATPDITTNSNYNPAYKALVGLDIPAFSQRDRNQYRDEAEWKIWSPSACSATAVAALLHGYGKKVITTDILSIMQKANAISATAGLYDNSVFARIAAQYNMRSILDEDKNLDTHFGRILDYLRQGIPMLLNWRDPAYFPNGHFGVAVRLNPDNTVRIINTDPAPGRPVVQDWPVDTLKLYFSRSLRSVVFLTY